jgi:imidazolonepropionase-like amidohydrolase
VTAQDLAISGGMVHTVAGPPMEGATVLILGGVIAEVGTDVEIPADIRRIDASGKVVTPGLFEATTNIGLVEVSLASSTRDYSLDGDLVRAAFDVTDGLNPNSVLIPVSRVAGITTVLTRPSGGLIAGQAAVIDLDGASLSDVLVRRRAAMMASYGSRTAGLAGGPRGAVSLRLREALDDAQFWREHRSDFDRGMSRGLAYSRLDMQALLPVLDGEMPLVVSVNRASDIESVLRLAEEYGIDLVLEGVAEGWMLADRLADVGVPVIVKPLTNSPGFSSLGARFDNAALLHSAGVEIIIGGFSSHRAGYVTVEAGNAVRFGLPWEAALRALTLAPSEAFGVAEAYGSIEVGKAGNLVVWSGDPFELSTHAEAVVIRGRRVPSRSRQTELLERYRTIDSLPPAYRGGREPGRTP